MNKKHILWSGCPGAPEAGGGRPGRGGGGEEAGPTRAEEVSLV